MVIKKKFQKNVVKICKNFKKQRNYMLILEQKKKLVQFRGNL